MSEPILPFAWWLSGTNENSIPANDNLLRLEILHGLVLSDSTNVQPGSPEDGDIYIMTGAASGDQWADFDEFDLAIYKVPDGAPSGTWHAYAPAPGIRVNIDGTLYTWNGAAYEAIGGAGGSVPPVVTESTTSLTASSLNSGNYTRFTNAGAKSYTFDSAQTYTAGEEYHGRNVGAGDLTLVGAGSFVLNAPAGGTLVVPQGGTFTVKVVSAAEADVFGVTEAA